MKQFKIIMNYQSMPSYPLSKKARAIFSSILDAEAATRKEFTNKNWPEGTKASVVTVKSNGQHGQILLTLVKSDKLINGDKADAERLANSSLI
jgi:hypothetical protein